MSKAQKKPGIGVADGSVRWAQRISEVVEIVCGRRGRKTDPIAITAATVTAAPTAADHNKVVADLNALKARFNDLLNQVQD